MTKEEKAKQLSEWTTKYVNHYLPKLEECVENGNLEGYIEIKEEMKLKRPSWIGVPS